MTLILIDARNALFRYGMRHIRLESASGVPTGVIYGLLSAVYQLKRAHKDARFVMVWDGGSQWRREFYSGYKGNRGIGEPSDDVRRVTSQEPIVRQVFELLKVPQLLIAGVEADDIIGVLARKFQKRGYQVLVHSSDKDFYQLMKFGVGIVNHGSQPITEGDVKKRFGCTSKDVLKFRIMTGDSSDNIGNPVRGLGVKTALKLLAAGLDPIALDPHTVDPKWDEKLRDAWSLVRRNHVLMRLPVSFKSARYTDQQRLELLAARRRVLSVLHSEESADGRACTRLLIELSLQEALEHRSLLFHLQK